jgi:exosortase/archaeosortase family protein
VALIVPLAVAKNAIRIFTLSTLAMYVDPGFLAGPLHTRGGIVFFALAVGGMLLALRLLQWMENRRSPTLLPSSTGQRV